MKVLIVERQGDVLRLRLNRPEVANALAPELVEALTERVLAAPGEGVRLLVLEGEGRNFCGGFDFSDLEQIGEGEVALRALRIEALLQALAASPILTLALVRGAAYGAGADLALMCRRKIATPAARFLMPGLQFGVVLGTARFAALVGKPAAERILGCGKPFTAAEALSVGAIEEIAEEADWPARVAALAEEAALLSPEARADLHRLTGPDDLDRDMAATARSVLRPGLKQRVADYRARSRAKKSATKG